MKYEETVIWFLVVIVLCSWAIIIIQGGEIVTKDDEYLNLGTRYKSCMLENNNQTIIQSSSNYRVISDDGLYIAYENTPEIKER